jgi:hypothetical protein
MFAHEGDQAQVYRVRAGDQAIRVNPQAGQDLGPYAYAEFDILSAFGFIHGLAVVVGAEKKGGGEEFDRLAGRRRGWLAAAVAIKQVTVLPHLFRTRVL